MKKTINNYKTGYVLMLDVLGFKDSVTKDYHNDFLTIWSDLNTNFQNKRRYYQDDENKSINLDVLCMSDTIILGLSHKSRDIDEIYDKRYLLSSMIRIIDSFFTNYMMEKKIFFRGVIGYGDFIFDNEQKIAMGNVIDEVSGWYESCDWIGISLSPSAQYVLEYLFSVNDTEHHPKALKNIKNRFIEYNDLPVKDNMPKVCKYAFCWYKRKNKNINKENYEKTLDLFSNMKHEPLYAKKYYEAIKFLKNCLIDNPI